MFISSPVYENIKFLKKNSDFVIKSINNISKEKNYYKVDNKSISLDLDLLKKDKDNLEFIKVIHFTNGNIKIFNLLSVPVYISEIQSNNQKN